MILGTISAIDEDNGIQVIIDGEDIPTTKKYSYLASYVPAEDDRVIIEEINGSYVIIGKIITETTKSGIVNYATKASTADDATNAVNAEKAAQADRAAKSDHAVEADSATTANNATKADSATTAASATTATTADNLNSANYQTQSGYLVSRVSREYDSTLKKYIVTDVTLDYTSHNYVYRR